MKLETLYTPIQFASSAKDDAAPAGRVTRCRTCVPLRYIGGSGSGDREHSPAARRLPVWDRRCPNLRECGHVHRAERALTNATINAFAIRFVEQTVGVWRQGNACIQSILDT